MIGYSKGERELSEKKNIKREEHILVCLSSAPSNARIIKTAAEMAEAFGGTFTALYVSTPASDGMRDSDRQRLDDNVKLAESLGADITTVGGEDIPYVISEFARISKVTKVVLGRSNVKRRFLFETQTLTEKLIKVAPNLDIHIIPDSEVESGYKEKNAKKKPIPSVRNILITFFVLVFSSALCGLFDHLGFTEANLITVYILGALAASLLTKDYVCGAICSLFGVLLFNFLFTEPKYTFHATDEGYFVTFAIMLAASLFTGGLANKLQAHAKESAKSAYRTKILFDTNNLLREAESEDEAIDITATQLRKLLQREIAVYKGDGKFRIVNGEDSSFTPNTEIAKWVHDNKKRAGAGTERFSGEEGLYLSIRSNGISFGVIAIRTGKKRLEPFENSITVSLIGECALMLDGMRNAQEKEEAAVLMKNEQLRANLLRSISHDLRTPLTSISGNAENLLRNFEKIDRETRERILKDTYADSIYLIDLVENLLSITRIGDGRMKLNFSPELVDEVLSEAVSRMEKRSEKHKITLEVPDEIMLCNMDARLITQVIINLIDNAIKYSDGGEIRVSAKSLENEIFVSVSDCGDGVSDEMKENVFTMFYTGKQTADGRRSMGLGLALCKSIVEAHGGVIGVYDNLPHGATFGFTLKKSEVNLNE